MIVQLSSGIGAPVECEYAVTKIYESLQDEFNDIILLDNHESKTSGCNSSILFSTDNDLSFLEGSIQWICQSPFRPNHNIV